ncbi:vacuolar protein sorting-associated protein 16 homolog isoform X1 [Lepeophtheirus salmonis]|uniref:vacuolar protein sorting-associated protein 16 homolog isoform X1 n=2 Tax=Lepeophtheirus salmonis TaxID=72036 RepID=UPI001AE79C35|nr:vacuolar protein sorting-associated protein 16 homolog isoform X1 [Lepeophtheirus salmonis]
MWEGGGSAIHITEASGREISPIRKISNFEVFDAGWTDKETPILLTQDGTVYLYDLFGDELLKKFNLGSEVKDTKVRSCQFFDRDKSGTGIAVLTNSYRFFYVNSILGSPTPRIRRMPDVHLEDPLVWTLFFEADERTPKILVSSKGGEDLVLISPGGSSLLLLEEGSGYGVVTHMETSFDRQKLVVVFSSGLVWIGSANEKLTKIASYKLDFNEVSKVAWCSSDAVVVFPADDSSPVIVTVKGSGEMIFILGFIACVQEVDGLRIFSRSCGQELLQPVPKIVEETFKIGSISSSAMLHLASEEFRNKSYKADEYLRMVMPELGTAVSKCIKTAGYMFNTYHQKSLMKSAQFGKAFITLVQTHSDSFPKMCKTLRVLNALRNVRIGIPLTITQYETLTPAVVIDRLLARRLYPIAAKMCTHLDIPQKDGINRVMAHWACYKVSIQEDNSSTAREIHLKLGTHPSISYCDIASKAADYGKNELAFRLLEHEVRVVRQIPLLMKLGKESEALAKALATGDRDLAFLVIFKLKQKLNSSDFHMLIRKYPLGKVIYQNYCQQYDLDALNDWYVQEDDFPALASDSFRRAWESSRQEERLAILVQSTENFRKGKGVELCGYVNDSSKLLRLQDNLEGKMETCFIGKSLHETVSDLIKLDDMKTAEKVKSEFKIPDKRFIYLKLSAWAEGGKWSDIKSIAKQKKPPLPISSILKIVHRFGGDAKVKEFNAENIIVKTN